MKKYLSCIAICSVAFTASAFDVDFIDAPVNLNSATTINITREAIAAFPADKVLKIDYTLTPGTDFHCFKLVTAWGGTLLPDFVPTSAGDVLEVTTDGSYDYKLTADVIEKLKDQAVHGWDSNVTITGDGLTITRVYIGSLDEINMDNGYGYWPGLVIPGAVITNAQPGWRLVMEYSMNENAQNAGFSIATNYGNTDLPSFKGTTEINDKLRMPVSGDGSYELKLTQDDIDKMKDSEFTGWDGLRIVGSGFTIKKIYMARSENSGITEIVTDNDNEDYPVVHYDLQGKRVDNPTNGFYIRVKGDKVNKVLIK